MDEGYRGMQHKGYRVIERYRVDATQGVQGGCNTRGRGWMKGIGGCNIKGTGWMKGIGDAT